MKNITIITIALLTGSCTPEKPAGNTMQPDIYAGVEFDMPRVEEPHIPAYVVNIKDFGAVSGGQVLNSQAFADAIDDVSQRGGGKVVIPAGIWLTGPIILKSNLELHAEQGAVIIFSADKDLYPVIETSFEGLDTWRCLSPIYGKNLENIAFTGKGVWDGSGNAWRFVKKSKMTDSQWKELVASGGVVNDKENEWYPSEQFKMAHETANMNVPTGLTTKEEFEAIRDFLRPVMVSIQNSKRVLFDGPTFQNSPAWCIHPLMVEDLIVRNITVRNPWYSQNGDGIDIESCKNVLVYNSGFDVGDDAICIKSGKDEDGRRRGVPCENIVIKNNIVYHGHGGVTVGSEMSGGVKNMHVSGCTFMGTDVGLRFKSTRGRGGVVENIYISDIRMTDIPTQAISFDLYYGGKSVSEMLAEGGQEAMAQPEPVTIETPQFRNIFIRNVILKGAQQAIFLQGLPEMNLENIEISDMLLEAENGISVIDANGVKLSNIQLITKNETALEFYNSQNVEVKTLDTDQQTPATITINGEKTGNVRLSSGKTDLKTITRVGQEVDAREVKIDN
jgi:hypothetical protein